MNRGQIPVSIWWARRDLRLTDNQALATARSCSKCTIPVFVLDPALLAAGGSEKRVAFLVGGLAALDAELRQFPDHPSRCPCHRARMIAASFLIKDRLVDWGVGRAVLHATPDLWRPRKCNGAWQWTAGVGTDATPYFRVFKPTLQGLKFDSAGDYTRRCVIELTGVPGKHIHERWSMPAAIQEQSNCVIGRDCPFPIVDHAQARRRPLAVYRR